MTLGLFLVIVRGFQYSDTKHSWLLMQPQKTRLYCQSTVKAAFQDTERASRQSRIRQILSSCSQDGNKVWVSVDLKPPVAAAAAVLPTRA